MRVYKLYANLSTADDIAALDFQSDGFIKGYSFVVDPNGMDALNDSVKIELSFMSVNSFSANDTRGSIGMASVAQQFLTSGGGMVVSVHAIMGLDIPVSGGERVHVHCSLGGGATGDVNVYIYVEDGTNGTTKPARRRR